MQHKVIYLLNVTPVILAKKKFRVYFEKLSQQLLYWSELFLFNPKCRFTVKIWTSFMLNLISATFFKSRWIIVLDGNDFNADKKQTKTNKQKSDLDLPQLSSGPCGSVQTLKPAANNSSSNTRLYDVVLDCIPAVLDRKHAMKYLNRNLYQIFRRMDG